MPERFEIWHRSFQIFIDNPLTGIGPGQLSPVLLGASGLRSNPENVYVPHAHNVYLQVGLDYGVFGLAAFLVLLIAFFAGLQQIAEREYDPGLKVISAGLPCGLLSFLVYGLVNAIALGARGAIVLWVLLGLGAAATRTATASPVATTED